MSKRLSLLRSFRWPLSFATTLCILAGLLPMMAHQSAAQAVPASTWPYGDTTQAEQPLVGQRLGTDLTLNQGVNSISAENESFDRFNLGFEASGGVETNFFGTQTDKKTVGYGEFSAQAGLLFQTERTRYFVMYMPQYNVFPQYSEVNNFAQRFYQSLTHVITVHTGVAWDVTAARYLSLNQFLPQNLGIGGVGIVVPTVGQQLRQDSYQISNVATTINYRYLMSTRMTFTGALTSGFFLYIPADVAASKSRFSQRFVASGADLRLEYQLTPRNLVGGELTPIYIDGLRPGGHEIAEIVQATYQRQLTPTLSARVGAGPLFIQVSSPVFGSAQDTSYAVSALLSRQIRQSQFSLAYNRAFVVNLLSPSIVSNHVSFSTYMPLRSHWILVGTATYTNSSANRGLGSAKLYGGTAQISYQAASKVQIFARYSLLSQNFDRESSLQAYGFTRNQIGGGIRFALGNSTTRGGVQ